MIELNNPLPLIGIAVLGFVIGVSLGRTSTHKYIRLDLDYVIGEYYKEWQI